MERICPIFKHFPPCCGQGAHLAPTPLAWTIGTTLRAGPFGRHLAVARLGIDIFAELPRLPKPRQIVRKHMKRPPGVKAIATSVPFRTSQKTTRVDAGRIQMVTAGVFFSRFILLLPCHGAGEGCRALA